MVTCGEKELANMPRMKCICNYSLKTADLMAYIIICELSVKPMVHTTIPFALSPQQRIPTAFLRHCRHTQNLYYNYDFIRIINYLNKNQNNTYITCSTFVLV